MVIPETTKLHTTYSLQLTQLTLPPPPLLKKALIFLVIRYVLQNLIGVHIVFVLIPTAVVVVRIPDLLKVLRQDDCTNHHMPLIACIRDPPPHVYPVALHGRSLLFHSAHSHR